MMLFVGERKKLKTVIDFNPFKTEFAIQIFSLYKQRITCSGGMTWNRCKVKILYY